MAEGTVKFNYRAASHGKSLPRHFCDAILAQKIVKAIAPF